MKVRSHAERGNERRLFIDEGSVARHPADLAAGELDLQPTRAFEAEPGLDAAMQRQVRTLRIRRPVALAKNEIVLGDDHDRIGDRVAPLQARVDDGGRRKDRRAKKATTANTSAARRRSMNQRATPKQASV